MITINGRLVGPGTSATKGFVLSEKFWDWAYLEFPKFIGKEIEITVNVKE